MYLNPGQEGTLKKEVGWRGKMWKKNETQDILLILQNYHYYF